MSQKRCRVSKNFNESPRRRFDLLCDSSLSGILRQFWLPLLFSLLAVFSCSGATFERLDGKWEYSLSTKPMSVDQAGLVWRQIQLPTTVDPFDFRRYRELHVMFRQRISESILALQGKLGLRTDLASNVCSYSISNKHIGTVGSITPYVPGYHRRTLFEFDRSDIDEANAYFTIHCSTFGDLPIQLRGEPEIGSYETVRKRHLALNAVLIVLAGIFVGTGIFYFLLWSFRRREHRYWVFGGLTILFAIFAGFEGGLREILVDDVLIRRKISLACAIFMPIFLLLYVRLSVQRNIGWLAKGFILISCGLTIALVFSQYEGMQIIYLILSALFVAACLSAAIVVAPRAWAGHRRERTLLISVLILFATGAQDLLHDAGVIHTVLLSALVFPAFLAFSAVRLSREFGSNYEQLRRLTIELEQRVADRTETITQQKKRIDGQIDVARRIQESLLPVVRRRLKGGSVAFRYLPAEIVSGDTLNIYPHKSYPSVELSVFDVSGHGVGAAFLSALVRMSMLSWSEEKFHPKENLEKLRHDLHHKMVDHFLTAALCHVDLREAKLYVVSAGHPPVLLVRQGELTRLQPKGKPVFAHIPDDPEELEIDLEKGDKIVIYTDGLLEISDANEIEFGSERFEQVVREQAVYDPETMCTGIVDRVLAYGSNETLEDDLTLLVFEFVGL